MAGAARRKALFDQITVTHGPAPLIGRFLLKAEHAVHHRGGTPTQRTGSAPMTKNEGVLISRVIAGLQQSAALPQ